MRRSIRAILDRMDAEIAEETMDPSLFDAIEDAPTHHANAAAISECGKYRYSLARVWGMEPAVLFIMLNPSIADADIDDPTIRKCIGFAKRDHAGGITVANLYAWRSTDPAGLKSAADPVGPDNDRAISECLTSTGVGRVVVAWGAHAKDQKRVDAVLKLIGDAGFRPFCLGKTNAGQPRHPLMVAYATPFEEYR